MTELERLLQQLSRRGHEVEQVEDGALLDTERSQLALFAERDEEEGGVIVRAHLDLDLYVEQDAVGEVSLGVNLLNGSLDFGSLTLDPVEEEGEAPMFAVLGRTALLLRDLGEGEIARLERHLERFEREVSGAVERSLAGPTNLKA